MKKIWIALIIMILFITACTPNNVLKLDETDILKESKLKSTAYYHNKDGDGRRFAIVAGIHGDESAGFIAADEMMGSIISNYPEATILFIPRANELAIEEDRRYADGYEDLNRTFNAEDIDSETKKLASAIKKLIIEFEPEFVLDHHESRNNYLNSDGKYRLGNTIIVSDKSSNVIDTLFILDNINPRITDDIDFILESNPPEGSFNKTISEKLGIYVATIETNRKLPLEKRVKEQKIVASEIIKYFLEN